MRGPYSLIANARAGRRDRRRLEALRHALERALDGPLQQAAVHSGRGIRHAAQAARDRGQGTVFVAGGDGTISGVADILKGSQVALAVLPMGTFNFFARGLEIPEDADRAVAALARGQVRQFPVGEINGQVFLNNSSLGLYPAILAAREGIYQKWGRSRMAAYWSVLRTLVQRGHRMRLTIEVDGQTHHVVTPMVFIGSNPFQLAHFRLDGAEHLAEGRLALYYGPDASRWGMLRTAVWLAAGRARKDSEFRLLAGREITITIPRRRVTAALDGERFTFAPPIRVRLRHDLLRVVIPAPDGDAGAA
jgi:diacylglycerol kinase family enzyme